MMVVMMTSLPAADCSTFLPLRREKLDRQWFGDGGSAVQPVPTEVDSTVESFVIALIEV